MAKKRNFTYQQIQKKQPDEIVNISLNIPAFLIQDIKEYGGITKRVTEALLRSHRGKYTYDLRDMLSQVQKNIESLELWKDNGPAIDEGEIDQHHLQMLEMYKSIYHIIKGSRLLRKKPKPKDDESI